MKQFFKMKRNQQVVVSSVIEKDVNCDDRGKSRNNRKRLCHAYKPSKTNLDSLYCYRIRKIPFGFPSYSNTHQHFIYDNQLQQKLVLQFGETVAKREALIKQFFEESLQTNLNSWRGMWVEVKTAEKAFFGKIKNTTKKELFLQLFKKEKVIHIKRYSICVYDWVFPLWKKVLKSIFK